jgi:hypothetical protein
MGYNSNILTPPYKKGDILKSLVEVTYYSTIYDIADIEIIKVFRLKRKCRVKMIDPELTNVEFVRTWHELSTKYKLSQSTLLSKL